MKNDWRDLFLYLDEPIMGKWGASNSDYARLLNSLRKNRRGGRPRTVMHREGPVCRCVDCRKKGKS